MLDFAKAFDTIEHEPMINIMRAMGFNERWLKWISCIFFFGKIFDLVKWDTWETILLQIWGASRWSSIAFNFWLGGRHAPSRDQWCVPCQPASTTHCFWWFWLPCDTICRWHDCIPASGSSACLAYEKNYDWLCHLCGTTHQFSEVHPDPYKGATGRCSSLSRPVWMCHWLDVIHLSRLAAGHHQAFSFRSHAPSGISGEKNHSGCFSSGLRFKVNFCQFGPLAPGYVCHVLHTNSSKDRRAPRQTTPSLLLGQADGWWTQT